jgi:hypothetical protein
MNTPTDTPDERRARRFCVRFGLALLALLGAVVGLNLLIDPFGFRDGGDSWPAGKREVAYLINKRLATLAAFESAPVDNIILGDSRGARLSADVLTHESGAPWRNLAFGAATLEEMTALYRHLAQRRPLRTVVLIVPFNRFTRTYAPNGVDEAVALAAQPWKLYASGFYLRASLEVAVFGLTGTRFRSDEPAMTPERFADYQLKRERADQITVEGMQAAHSMLNALLDGARAAGTRTVLVAPPAHPRMLEIYQTQFAEQFAAFKAIMSAHETFIDYERPGFETELGSTAEFKDMFHLSKTSSEALTRSIQRRLAAHTQY